jgi:hypothetical protein
MNWYQSQLKTAVKHTQIIGHWEITIPEFGIQKNVQHTHSEEDAVRQSLEQLGISRGNQERFLRHPYRWAKFIKFEKITNGKVQCEIPLSLGRLT